METMTSNKVSDFHLYKIIDNARLYYNHLVDQDFLLICSETSDVYHVIFRPEQFQHLTGVLSVFRPREFFEKCIEGAFDELSNSCSYKRDGKTQELRSYHVKQKNNVLPEAIHMFEGAYDLYLVKDVSGARFHCAFGTGNNIPGPRSFIMGFTPSGRNGKRYVPMTLLKDRLYRHGNPLKVDYIFGKQKHDKLFKRIVIGDTVKLDSLLECMPELEYLVDLAAVRENINKHS